MASGRQETAPYAADNKGVGWRRFEQGRVIGEADMLNGTGSFRTEVQDLIVEGSCRDGLRDGTWTARGRDGVTRDVRTYRLGVLHGPYLYERDYGGEVREGRRVGRWSTRMHGECVELGPVAHGCYHQPCVRRVAGARLTVNYGDGAGEVKLEKILGETVEAVAVTVEEIGWEEASPQEERLPEQVKVPGAKMERSYPSCKDLPRARASPLEAPDLPRYRVSASGQR